MLFRMHGTHGNRFVQRVVQTKFDHPSNLYEREANHAADPIAAMPDAVPSPLAQRVPTAEEEKDKAKQTQPPSAPAQALLPPNTAPATPIEEEEEKKPGHTKVSRAPEHQAANGVLPHAEEAVAAASNSAGQPLPCHLERKFEQALGADLSGVRVHTGPESISASKAISARAYTTGNDIHFNAGQYDPQSLEGQRLLAHEVVHTVQQQGATPIRQQKLEVSSADDSFEIEADRTAEVMLQEPHLSAPFEPGKVPNRHENNSTGASSICGSAPVSGRDFAQRLTIPAPGAGMGVRVFGADDDSAVHLTPQATYWVNGKSAVSTSFGEGQRASLQVSPGTQGIVQMTIPAHIFIDNSLPFTNKEFEESATIDWPIAVSPEGRLTISDALPVTLQQRADPMLYLGSVEATKGDGCLIATVTIVNTTTHGRSAGAGYSVEQQTGGRTYTRQFRLNIVVPEVEPHARVALGPIRVLRRHAVLFERPGQNRTSNSEEQALIGWYSRLSNRTRESIERGGEPLNLEGHASTTGGAQQNRELSNARMEDVQRILRQFAGSQAVINNRALGAYEAETGPNVEAQSERKVEVSVWETAEPGENEAIRGISP